MAGSDPPSIEHPVSREAQAKQDSPRFLQVSQIYRRINTLIRVCHNGVQVTLLEDPSS